MGKGQNLGIILVVVVIVAWFFLFSPQGVQLPGSQAPTFETGVGQLNAVWAEKDILSEKLMLDPLATNELSSQEFAEIKSGLQAVADSSTLDSVKAYTDVHIVFADLLKENKAVGEKNDFVLASMDEKSDCANISGFESWQVSVENRMELLRQLNTKINSFVTTYPGEAALEELEENIIELEESEASLVEVKDTVDFVKLECEVAA